MADSVDRFERLTNLVTYLLAQKQGVTFAQILSDIPGWPEKDEARRRAFERDKRVLRDEGIPLLEEQGTYRIPPEQFYLPDLDLTEDEQVALRLAIAAVPGTDDPGGSALHKLTLGAMSAGPDAVPVVAALDPQPLLPVLHAAIRSRAPVRFTYRGSDEPREVEATLLFFREGAWYLSGHDRTRDAPRSFRVDRITSGVEVLESGSFDREPLSAAQAVPRQPWLFGDTATADEAVVDVDPVLAAKAELEAGERAHVERRQDGGIRIRMPVTNRDGFRTWLLGMLEHAVVVEPADLRQEVISWLEAMA